MSISAGNQADQNTQFSIRGVTQNDFNDIIEAPNAVYLDEGYLAVAQAQTFAVFDIRAGREILKGPQGTLFGRNATGGLMHPSNKSGFTESSGYVDVNVGTFDSPAALIVMLSKQPLAALSAIKRLVVLCSTHHAQDGYLNNLYPAGALPLLERLAAAACDQRQARADLGSDKTIALRGAWAFKLNDSLQIDWSIN